LASLQSHRFGQFFVSSSTFLRLLNMPALAGLVKESPPERLFVAAVTAGQEWYQGNFAPAGGKFDHVFS
jgi:hypothetical protein